MVKILDVALLVKYSNENVYYTSPHTQPNKKISLVIENSMIVYQLELSKTLNANDWVT